MSYTEKLQQIKDLQDAITQYGIIPVELLNKINYKLRLEWNYTSNSMEGNSLTRRETRTVMVDAIDVNGKPLKDIQEMKNHDRVISTIMKMGKGELNISESRIKEIHTGIMYEEAPENQKYTGQWKNVDNYMYNFAGERFDFVPHAQVPERMHQLVNWTNAEKEKIERLKPDAIHPLSLAVKFHLDYLNIHPFYDGNGRTARILTNLILISFGYPPIYVNENEKTNYYKYLTDIQSYGGDTDLFYEFMADLLIRSLKITLNTLEGKDIEEEEDFIKELQLLKAKVSVKGKPKSPKVLYNSYGIIETELWAPMKDTLKHFAELFNESRIIRKINNRFVEEQSSAHALRASVLADALQYISKKKIFDTDPYSIDIRNIGWDYNLLALNGADAPTDFLVRLNVEFEYRLVNIKLLATGANGNNALETVYDVEKYYQESFSSEEITSILGALKKHLISEIKKRTNDLN